MTRGSVSGKKAAQIARRDGGWKCHYCGRELITDRELYVRYQDNPQSEEFGRLAVVDHVVPKSKGGSDSLNNLVLACRTCNGKKGTKDRDEFITWIDFGEESETNIRIRRAAHGADNPYFLVRRATAQDDALSWEALGLLTYVLSKPDDWSVKPSDLRQRCGRDKVYKILNELIGARYVRRVENLDDKGRHVSTYYEIFESPLPEKPEAVKPDTASPDTEKPDSTYKREKQKRDSRNTEITKRSVLGESESALAEAIAQVTRCDPILNENQIDDLARDLLRANYSAQDVLNWHENFWPNDWRSRGGSPSLKEVRQLIGQIRAQVKGREQREDPYCDDDYLKDYDPAAPVAERQLPRALYTGRWKTQWLATLGQLSIQLNKSTYDTWLGHIDLIDVIEREDLVLEFQAEVPHHYAKDWIDRHLLASMEQTVFAICNFGERENQRKFRSGAVAQSAKISITVKGSDVDRED